MTEHTSREELIQRIRTLEIEVAQLKLIEKQLQESEELLRTYIANTPLSVVMCDRDMRWLAYSQQVIDDYQLEPKNYIGAWHYDIVPDLPDHWRDDHRKALAGERIQVHEEQFQMKNGQVGWVRREILPWRHASGDIGGIIIFNEIITKRKKAEELLRISEANYRGLFDAEPDAILIVDGETRQIVDVNRSAIELYGYPRDEIIGLNAVRLSAEPEKSAEHIRKVQKNISENKPLGTEERLHKNKDGTVFPVEITIGSYSRDGNKMICAMIRDITRRRRKEEALRELQIQQEAILNSIPDMAWLKDRESRFIAINEAFGNACGTKPKNLIGKTDFDVWPRKLAEKYCADDREVIKTNQRKILDEPLAPADGQRKWIETIKTPIFDDTGAVIGTTGIARDITQRKLAESALEAEKERLVVTLRSIGDGVITTDKTGRITLINRIAEKLTGWKEADAVGQPLERVFRIVDEFTRQPCPNPVQQVIARGQIVGLVDDTILISKEGRETVIADSGAPIMDSGNNLIGVVLVFRDVTEARRMENEILKVEKLESLGVLAGGIAHDFNNFLAAIIGNLSLAKLEANAADPIYDQLQEMEKAAMRAKNLTQQLLTFSRGGEPVRKPTDLAHLVRESASFAVRGSNVRCEVNFGPGSLIGDVDEGQVTQVIHNLTLNAVQAMPEGGLISISGECIDIYAGNNLTLNAGPYVKLNIEDHGTGIKKEHIQKIFDPYFTTKQKGSGLGLAIAHSVIEKHNGAITVESELGLGTTYRIFLPAIRESDPKMQTEKPVLDSGGGRILVMDDEEFICKLASDMLTRMGFEVATTHNGEEAIHRYQQSIESGRKYDAVILDLTIPGAMGGKETIKKLLEIDADVRAIVSSGYSNDPVLSDYARYGFRQAVSKPYRIQDLSEALKAILGK